MNNLGEPLPIDTIGADYPGLDPQPMGPITDLAYIRAIFPFVPILGIPRTIATAIIAADPNTGNPIPADLNIPAEVVLGRFIADTDQWYACFEHNAQIPTPALVASVPDFRTMYRPDYGWFYVGGRKSVSVISPNVGAIIQFHGFIANKRPS